MASIEPSEIYSLMKEGIKNTFLWNMNLGPHSVYCFECKRAFESPKDHTVHKTYNRNQYYRYYEKVFNPTENIINKLLNTLEEKRTQAINCTNKTIEELIKQLEKLKTEKINEINSQFDIIDNNIKELKEYFLKAKNTYQSYFIETDNFYKTYQGNEDKENTIFLMHYDLIENYQRQNEKLRKELSNTEEDLSSYSSRVDEEIKITYEQINNILSLNVPLEKYDDLYWDSNNQTNKYLDHIEQFKDTVKEIYNTYGNLGQIKEALLSFDSKTKRGVDYLFSQDFFLEGGGNIQKRKNSLRRYSSNKKLKNSFTANSIDSSRNKGGNSGIFYTPSFNKINSPSSRRLSPKHSNIISSSSRSNSNSKYTPNLTPNERKVDIKNINLSNPLLQRFFCYSFLSYFNKNFCPDQDKETINTNPHFLLDYAKKQRNMKEYIKPIPGTNKISIYNPNTKKLSQVEVKLSIEDHGYNTFPDGCRSIFINDKLYITGGKDTIGNTLGIVNMVDLNEGKIYSQPQMKAAHAYHSIDYLENYECLIVIGGKDENYYCEIYDIFANKWQMLPNLNYCRFNANIVYNSFAGEIYVLFGMLDNGRNTDIIELLELKDIKGGWIKIDYAKTALFDLQMNYCKVIQFNSEKLLIYGANDYRNIKKQFALYLIDRNEIVKVEAESDKREIALFEREVNNIQTNSMTNDTLNSSRRSTSKRLSKSGNKTKTPRNNGGK
ncbi:MAG: hypothetical protein MJ252_19220 [archaeon]|nr:hypothetical protein [archaeon]